MHWTCLLFITVRPMNLLVVFSINVHKASQLVGRYVELAIRILNWYAEFIGTRMTSSDLIFMYPAGIYLLKETIETLEQSVKYVQS